MKQFNKACQIVYFNYFVNVFRALLSNLKMSQLQLVFRLLAHLFSIFLITLVIISLNSSNM